MAKLKDLFPEMQELPSTTYVVLNGRHREYLAKAHAVFGGKQVPASVITSRVIAQALDDFIEKYGQPA